MARYYFHVREGVRLIRDLEGLDLPDGFARYSEFARLAQEVLGESEWAEEITEDRAFEIVDQSGQNVLTVPFARNGS